VIAASLAAEIFNADFAEVRVASGAMANLYTFMAVCDPGDTIIAPPASIGGHVTHHADGCAGLYHLKTLHAPISADGYTVDVDGLAKLAKEARPKLITLGSSLNLFEHPVAEVAQIARDVGAKLMFDAAHQCGIIAGGAWANPLDHGADVMTMSTYKSLGGPAGGLLVSRDAALIERIDAIAFPGLTANFDAGRVARVAALAATLIDWREHGAAYAAQMISNARALASALDEQGIAVFAKARGYTDSHQFALEAAPLGGGQAASRRLAKAGFLTCGIGLPLPEIDGDLNGLRIGTPEITRWGMTPADMPDFAILIAEALRSDTPEDVLPRTKSMRDQFRELHYMS